MVMETKKKKIDGTLSLSKEADSDREAENTEKKKKMSSTRRVLGKRQGW